MYFTQLHTETYNALTSSNLNLHTQVRNSSPESSFLTKSHFKNKSAMHTWGLMLSFTSFGWNAVLKYQNLGVE